MIRSIPGILATNRFSDATSNVFVATNNNLWSNTANWSYARVPLSTDRARIRSLCFMDVTSGVCQDLLVDDFELIINSTRTLTVGLTVVGNFSTSKITNKGTISYSGATTPMATGVLDCSSFANSFYYTSSNVTLKGTNYWALFLQGGGTKILSQNTTLSYLSVSATIFEVSNFNLTNAGVTDILTTGRIIKSGTGTIIFGGLVSTGANAFDNLTASGGGNTFEFRGGFNAVQSTNLGTANVVFSTNNQTVTTNNTISFVVNGTITIKGVILTLDTSNYITGGGGTYLYGDILGENTCSILNRNRTYFYGSLVTGVTSISSGNATNTFNYLRNGNQGVMAGTYGNLTLGGTATPNDKTLQGNVSVVGTYSVSGNAVRVNNGFTFGNP